MVGLGLLHFHGKLPAYAIIDYNHKLPLSISQEVVTNTRELPIDENLLVYDKSGQKYRKLILSDQEEEEEDSDSYTNRQAVVIKGTHIPVEWPR